MATRSLRLAGVLALAIGAAALAASPAGATKGGGHHETKPQAGGKVRVGVLATGLHNPRHLIVGSSHEVFVAEAGQGAGAGCTTHVFIGPEAARTASARPARSRASPGTASSSGS